MEGMGLIKVKVPQIILVRRAMHEGGALLLEKLRWKDLDEALKAVSFVFLLRYES